MIYQDTLTIFLCSRLCTWSINTPPKNLNGESKNRTTPTRFDLFFFLQHNALTSLRLRPKAALYFLFNIRFIIRHAKRAINALYILGEMLRGRDRRQHQPRPSHKPSQETKQRLTLAPIASGTKCTTTPAKRSNETT